MRSLYLLTAAAFAISGTCASATITIEPASGAQGTLVHGTGTEATGLIVTADLGTNGPNIVNFDGTTTTNNELQLQGGSGQADVTGAEINPAPPHNDFSNIASGNIWLTGYQNMSWIELGLDPLTTGTVDFTVTDNFGVQWSFDNVAIGPGNTHFGFLGSNGEFITNLYYSMDNLPTGGPNYVTSIQQVRISAVGAVPEPATWAMMLLGFGAIGFAVRLSRSSELPQLA